MSNRHRVRKTHAIILRRRDFSEADRILTVYTPADGKQEFIARGIRKTTSRKAGHLETFSHASLLVAEGRTWDIVTEVTTVESYRRLKEDLDLIGQASYVCELVDRFTEVDNENRPMWELLTGMLRLIDSAAGQDAYDSRLLLRWFELRLLTLTGFQPQLFHCIECGNEIEPVKNYFSLQHGGVLCPTCGSHNSEVEAIPVEALKALRHLQRNNWEDVSHLRLNNAQLHPIESLLYRYLVAILERRLVSVDFLHRLRSLAMTSAHEAQTPALENRKTDQSSVKSPKDDA